MSLFSACKDTIKYVNNKKIRIGNMVFCTFSTADIGIEISCNPTLNISK